MEHSHHSSSYMQNGILNFAYIPFTESIKDDIPRRIEASPLPRLLRASIIDKLKQGVNLQ